MTWIRNVFRRRALERDLAEEIRQHLDEKVDDLMLQGISRDEATRRARREFGNSTLVEEQGRDVWRWPFVEDGMVDLRMRSGICAAHRRSRPPRSPRWPWA
jgi:hypothetical protein